MAIKLPKNVAGATQWQRRQHRSSDPPNDADSSGRCAISGSSALLPLKLPGLRPKLQAEAAGFRMNDGRAIEILLVEDNPGDARLAWEAIREARVCNNLRWVADGVEALAYLRREGKFAEVQRPDLILLDLNLPRKDGREVLAEIKNDENLRRIPVVVLTTSQAEEDILKAYHLNANCYISKPVDLERFIKVVNAIENFWLTIVKLPSE